MNASSPRTRTLLAGITAVVLLAHWGVLHGLPLNLDVWAAKDNGPAPAVRAFTTRTISEQRFQAVPAAEPAPVIPVARTPRPQPALTQAPATSDQFIENTAAVLVQQARSTTISGADSAEPAAPVMSPAAAPATLAPPQSAEPAPLATADAAKMPAGASVDTQAIRAFAFPASASLSYDVRGEEKGFPYFVNGKLDWQHDGVTYNARLEVSHFLLGARVQTSKGTLTAEGLTPLRFGDKYRSEVAAHFQRAKGIVSFSANTPDVPLLPGAQDQLSVFLQLASMIGGDPARFPPGTQIAFQAIGPRSAQRWVFNVGALEVLKLPGGIQQAIHVTRDPVNEFEPRAEAWLSPDMAYLPVRIRLSQSNGDFVEQQWKSTKYPQ